LELSLIRIVLFFIISLSLQAQNNELIDFDALLEKSTQLKTNEAGVSYLHFTPIFEENPDPSKLITVEFYYGEINESPESKAQMNWLVDHIKIDRTTFKNNDEFKVWVKSPYGVETKDDDHFNTIIDNLEVKGSDIIYEQAPRGSLTSRIQRLQKSGRAPSSLKLGQRRAWTLIRLLTSGGSAYASLTLSSGFSQGMAIINGLVPGIASAGLTYHSGRYGRWLTNESWSTKLLNSSAPWARKLKQSFFMKPALDRMRKIDNNIRGNPTIRLSKTDKFLHVLYKSLKGAPTALKASEEYIKWWATEVAFVGVTLNLPQAISKAKLMSAGWTDFLTNIKGMTTFPALKHGAFELLKDATIATFAQGPGDVAIQKHKYLQIQALKDKVIAGKIRPKQKVQLLKQIEDLLARKTVITDKSHFLLRRIENMARMKAAIFSAFSVGGLALKLSGSQSWVAVLVGVGVTGTVYLGYVRNVFKIKTKIDSLVDRYITPVKARITMQGTKALVSYPMQKVLPKKVVNRMRNILFRYCIRGYL
jgi:hypothetical protein